MAPSLSELKPGQTAVVAKIAAKGEVRRRILAMGVSKGAEIKVEGVAPLGDPIDILVKGYHLSLRKEDAKNILVGEVKNG
jgi:Fe2+ transport system protein FeoA